ncbi:unnamed protein product [Lactuca saligna]|uniref:Trichome birefringence-like C-terminal domain-containing protein n=1 Tax=Lactuca saligna TaxID=75948 RepID=A0AA35VCI7_LACSI|nr:unnamed protein product [Lactuca saligna]
MFVGDSLGRKQQESLICMTSSAVPQSTTKISINDPISTLKFLLNVIGIHEQQFFDDLYDFCCKDGISDRTTNLPHMSPSEEAFVAAVSALGIEKKDGVVVYDGKGIFSAARVW